MNLIRANHIREANRQEWMPSLLDFVAKQRLASPIPTRASLSPEEKWHCRLLTKYVKKEAKWWIQQINQYAASQAEFDEDFQPVIIFTTSQAGLIAAGEAAPAPSSKFVYLSENEYSDWHESYGFPQGQGPRMHSYQHYWSYIKPLSRTQYSSPLFSEYERAVTQYPAIPVDTFRLHVKGWFFGTLAMRVCKDLWQWDGKKATLLERNFWMEMA